MSGCWVVQSEMQPGYIPPSANLNPDAHVTLHCSTCTCRTPEPAPTDDSWLTMEDACGPVTP